MSALSKASPLLLLDTQSSKGLGDSSRGELSPPLRALFQEARAYNCPAAGRLCARQSNRISSTS